MKSDKTLLIIPARMTSSRFPGKPLAKILGIPMLERVWKIANSLKSAVDVYIATDAIEIKQFSESIGAKVLLTSNNCLTGMDRAAEALTKTGISYRTVVTLQGDAVLTPPWVVDQVINAITENPDVKIATPLVKLCGETLSEYLKFKAGGTSTGTTAVFDKNFNALYFSKGLLPHTRDYSKLNEMYRHIGLYAYKAEILLKLASMEQSRFELIENLEQLRALENGIPIRVVPVDYKGRTHASVDNPEDIKIAEEIIKKEGELF